jgi:hypothetical protein
MSTDTGEASMWRFVSAVVIGIVFSVGPAMAEQAATVRVSVSSAGE